MKLYDILKCKIADYQKPLSQADKYIGSACNVISYV